MVQILRIIFGMLSVGSMIGCSITYRRLLPGKEEKREKYSILAMIYALIASFFFFLAFFIQDVLSNMMYLGPIFIVSVIVGLIFRASANSSYELSNYLLKKGQKRNNSKKDSR